MSLDMDGLEEYVYDILIKNKDYEPQAKLMWLDGFNSIINDSIMDFEKFENLILYSASKGSRTERPHLNAFYEKYKKKIDDEVLIPAFINLNYDFHLALWVERLSGEKDDYCKIFYCEEGYGVRYNKKYPAISLRLNNIPYENNELPLRVTFNGQITNTYDAFARATPDLLINSYVQVSHIVENAITPTMNFRKEKKSSD